MEHKHKDGMIDNRKIESNRQAGIERVIQRKGEMGRTGQSGKMEKMPSEKSNWRRPEHGTTTPRSA